MGFRIILAVLAMLVGGRSACHASLRVVFEGTLSRFDAGFESLLAPGELVSGGFTIPSPTARHETQFFGVTGRSSGLSEFSLSGASGWTVDLDEGLVTEQASAPVPGQYNTGLFLSGYRYMAHGGYVTWPIPADPWESPQPDMYGGIDFPDFVPLPMYLPAVLNPLLEFQVAGPRELWDVYGGSMIPPPLAEATSTTIKINVDVYVPLVGLQRRTAEFNITQFSVIPEPMTLTVALPLLLVGLKLLRKS